MLNYFDKKTNEVVQAIQLDINNIAEVLEFAEDWIKCYIPSSEEKSKGKYILKRCPGEYRELFDGDWIVKYSKSREFVLYITDSDFKARYVPTYTVKELRNLHKLMSF